MTFAANPAEIILAVLGGGSTGTPALLHALRSSQLAGAFGAMRVKLYGRDETRLRRLKEYSLAALRDGEGHSGKSGRAMPASSLRRQTLSVSTHTDIASTLRDATHVLCMVRPGGMAARARDEELALAAGVPADEGLAVGGLRCFLRGRNVIDALAERCARHAPRAFVLQMSSPLGLNVAVTRAVCADKAFGVCELPFTTAQALAREVQMRSGVRWSRHSHAGLNHQSWLYAFRDEKGRDITAQVLSSIGSDELFGTHAARIREIGAVPVHYLRLFLHTRSVLRSQRAAGSRGRSLEKWSRRVLRALCAGDCFDGVRVNQLLSERTMNWFESGVVPVLQALTQRERRRLVLNVPASVAGGPASAIVEVDCEVSSAGVQACRTTPLPPAAANLTRRLIEYERAVLALPPEPKAAQIADALGLHPLTPRRRIPALARALAEAPVETLQAAHREFR